MNKKDHEKIKIKREIIFATVIFFLVMGIRARAAQDPAQTKGRADRCEHFQLILLIQLMRLASGQRGRHRSPAGPLG